jgi:hypothetical protein
MFHAAVGNERYSARREAVFRPELSKIHPRTPVGNQFGVALLFTAFGGSGATSEAG